jgi:hypothetical protein
LEAELALDPTAAEAMSLWLELAEARTARGRDDAALAALRQALALDPRCWLARARELDSLRSHGSAEELARALARVAENLAEGPARGRHWLLAAASFARDARLPGEAREALERAEQSGVPAGLVRRVERALAHSTFDADSYRAATLRLLDSGVDEAERIGLELESWRHAFLTGDEGDAQARLTTLEHSATGARIARIAAAYAPPTRTAGPKHGGGALARLADNEPHPVRAAAFGWSLGLRLESLGERRLAIEALARVHASQPRHGAVAGTLTAWLHHSDPQRAAEVLRATAAARPDAPFAASLLMEAGLACWWAGEREVARQDFDAAERALKNPRAGALSAWARRATAGFGADTEAPTDGEERLLGALERATRAGAGVRDLAELAAALRSSGDAVPADLANAARLANLVASRALGVRLDPSELERTASASSEFARLVESFRFLEQIGQPEPSPRALEENARRWCAGDGGLVGALEWLAASVRLGQRRHEHSARRGARPTRCAQRQRSPFTSRRASPPNGSRVLAQSWRSRISRRHRPAATRGGGLALSTARRTTWAQRRSPCSVCCVATTNSQRPTWTRRSAPSGATRTPTPMIRAAGKAC